MHQLAIALHRKGHTISGSDDQIYDPSLGLLKKEGLLPKQMGWNQNNINTSLDAVILGMHAKPDNAELAKAKELNIPVYSFPAFIYESTKDKERVVIAGSHGKTTITSAIMHVLKNNQVDFDYLVGAQLEGFEQSVKLTDALLLVAEGDEYLSSPIHRIPKIHYYQPHIALLSGIAWDHYNVFPTAADYRKQFSIFLDKMPKGAVVIYNREDEQVCEVVEQASHLQCIGYGTPHFETKDGICYWQHLGNKIPLKIFGGHNLQNLNGARLICNCLGIDDEAFFKSIRTFKGAAKRLDVLLNDTEYTLFRDFAHAPSKVKATVEAVSGLHPSRALTACFELHTFSSLNKEFLPEYKASMNSADTAVVFYDEHTLTAKGLPMLDDKTVKEAFGKEDLVVFNNKKELIAFLKSTDWRRKMLLMMSSGTFGGVKNEELINFVR